MRFRFAAMHFTVSFSVVSFFIAWHFVCFTFVFLCVEIRMIWTRREWNWNSWKVNENEIYLLLHLVCLEWHSVMVEWWKLKNWQQHFFFTFSVFHILRLKRKLFQRIFLLIISNLTSFQEKPNSHRCQLMRVDIFVAVDDVVTFSVCFYTNLQLNIYFCVGFH